MRRVQIVDDDAGFGEFVRKVATGCGFDVEVTTDPTALRASWARAAPDLILLDLQMPGVDGIELLRDLSEAGCRASIMIMSGFDAKLIDTARRLGIARGLDIVGVISKPIRAAELRDILSHFAEPRP